MIALTEEQLRERHSILVDKKFLSGLTGEEALELAYINRSLDELEEPYYAEIKKRLALMQEAIITRLTVARGRGTERGGDESGREGR